MLVLNGVHTHLLEAVIGPGELYYSSYHLAFRDDYLGSRPMKDLEGVDGVGEGLSYRNPLSPAENGLS